MVRLDLTAFFFFSLWTYLFLVVKTFVVIGALGLALRGVGCGVGGVALDETLPFCCKKKEKEKQLIVSSRLLRVLDYTPGKHLLEPPVKPIAETIIYLYMSKKSVGGMCVEYQKEKIEGSKVCQKTPN